MFGKIKKLYKSSGKCDNQQQYKSIIKSGIASTTEGLTKNSPVAVGLSGTMKIQVKESC